VPEFVNPFSGKVPERPLTKEELIRAIRLDIAAEHEATHLYMAHAEAIDDPLARSVLIDIANEERVHVGEFMRLLSILTGDEDQWLAQGFAEVDEIAARMPTAGAATQPSGGEAQQAPGTSSDATTPAGAEPTLGSLRP
jgi:rubrerythrin